MDLMPDWTPFWLIRSFSEYGLQVIIVTGSALGVLIFQLIRRRVKRDISRFPWRIIIPLSTFYALYLFFYIYVDSHHGFHIEESLFTEYYYVGRVKDGMAIGEGRQFASVDLRPVYIYDGEWLNDRRQGQGTMKYAQNESTYTGGWENDERHGTGVIEHSNGVRWAVEFVHGVQKK